MDTNVRVDRTMFLTTVLVILFVAIPIIGFNEQSGLFITQLYNKITTNFGFVYQWYTIGIFGFLVWLASSRFGAIRFGDKDDRPEFGNLNWISMIFCAGVGAGMLYWALIEWSDYLHTPPRNLAEGSREAVSGRRPILYFTGVSVLGQFTAFRQLQSPIPITCGKIRICVCPPDAGIFCRRGQRVVVPAS